MIINENDPAIFVGAGKGIVDNLYFAQNRQFMQQHVDQHDVIFFGQRFAAVMTQETHVGIKIFVFFFGAGQLGFADVNQIIFSVVADAVGCLFNLVAKGRADLKHLLALFDFLQRGVNQPAAVSERKNFKQTGIVQKAAYFQIFINPAINRRQIFGKHRPRLLVLLYGSEKFLFTDAVLFIIDNLKHFTYSKNASTSALWFAKVFCAVLISAARSAAEISFMTASSNTAQEAEKARSPKTRAPARRL